MKSQLSKYQPSVEKVFFVIVAAYCCWNICFSVKTSFFVIIKTIARHWSLAKIFKNVSWRGFPVLLTASLIQKCISCIIFIVFPAKHHCKLKREYLALNTINISSKSLLTNNINNSRETFVHTSFNNSHFSFWRKLCVQRFNKYTANRFLF